MATSKKERSLQFFRRQIFQKNTFFFHFPITIILGIWWSVQDSASSTWAITTLVLMPASLLFAAWLSLRQIGAGKDKELYRKWLEKGQHLHQKASEARHELKGLLRSAWQVTAAIPAREFPNKLAVGLRNFNTEALPPVVTVNEFACGSEIIPRRLEDDENVTVLLVSVGEALTSNPHTLLIGVEGMTERAQAITIINPFRILQRWLDAAGVRWQCEGHGDERVIFLIPSEADSKYWSPVDGTTIAFDLLANGRLIDTFAGKWKAADGEWVIPIPSATKHNCRGRKIELRVSHAKGIKIRLPEPVVMTVNRQPVSV